MIIYVRDVIMNLESMQQLIRKTLRIHAKYEGNRRRLRLSTNVLHP